MASVTVPLGENSRWRAASSGAIPPIITRVGKEVDTLGGGDDFEGGLRVGGEPLLA